MKSVRSKVFWTLWALCPVALVAIHMGVGRPLREQDRAAKMLQAARQAETQEDWAVAAEKYAGASGLLGSLPQEERDAVELAWAKARMMAGEYVEGQEQLDRLLDSVLARPKTSPQDPFVRTLRSEVASAAHYASWAMRLEGAAEEDWLPESEIARQQYRLLTETQTDEDAAKNLETVIRFQRMTIEELRAQGMPKKCNGKGICKSKKNQRQSQCKKSGDPKDNRQQVKAAGSAADRGNGW